MESIAIHTERNYLVNTPQQAPGPSVSLPQEQAAVQPIGHTASAASSALTVTHESLQATFQYDRQFHQIIITLTRPDTGETVRQIPTEQAQRFMQALAEMAGRFFDGRA